MGKASPADKKLEALLKERKKILRKLNGNPHQPGLKMRLMQIEKELAHLLNESSIIKS